MALLAARCHLMVAIWLCATVTVSAEVCKDHILGCSFYTQDCEFMGRLCPRTCGHCLLNSEIKNPSSLNVDDSERYKIFRIDSESPLEGRYIGRTARAWPETDPGSPPQGRHTGRTARAWLGTEPGSPAESSHIGRNARVRTGTGWKPSISKLLSIGNSAGPLPPLGGDLSSAKEVQSIVADAFSHLNNVSEDNSLSDDPETYDGSLSIEQYKPLSYMDVTNRNTLGGGEYSTSQIDEAAYTFVYEEGLRNFDSRDTSKHDPVDLRLLDIDFLRKTGLLGEEIRGKHKNSQSLLTPDERKMVDLFVDQYKNLEESARVFNVSDLLEERTAEFIKFYEAGNSPAFSEFLYRLFTRNPSTGSYDDYFSESEEQVANFIDAIVTFDVNNLKRSI